MGFDHETRLLLAGVNVSDSHKTFIGDITGVFGGFVGLLEIATKLRQSMTIKIPHVANLLAGL